MAAQLYSRRPLRRGETRALAVSAGERPLDLSQPGERERRGRGAPGGGPDGGGSGWAGGIGGRVFRAGGGTPVEELGAGGARGAPGEPPPATGGAFGGSAAVEVPRVRTAALGPEEPQPVASVTA